jgi:hypothetical protein
MTGEHGAHCDEVLSAFTRDARAKYARGQAEHGGELWRKTGLLEHAKQEIQDLVTYAYTLQQQLPLMARTLAGLFAEYGPDELPQLTARIEGELTRWLLEPTEEP